MINMDRAGLLDLPVGWFEHQLSKVGAVLLNELPLCGTVGFDFDRGEGDLNLMSERAEAAYGKANAAKEVFVNRLG